MGWLKKTWNKVENAAKKVASNPIASAGVGLLTGGLTGAIVGGVASNQYARNQAKSELKNQQAEQQKQEAQKNREEAEKRRRLLSEAYGNIYGLGRTQSLINTPFRTLLGE